ncbi:MAG: hypothetical protein P1P81_02945 [Desulfobulbales bacterium]|nr:hypothetical protein [Desulfobulbales bacterium]
MMEYAEAKVVRMQKPSSTFAKWTALICGFCLVWLFILVVAPLFQKIEMVKTLSAYVEETGIDAGALYYTEVEEAAMAELGSRGTMEYPPTGPVK